MREGIREDNRTYALWGEAPVVDDTELAGEVV
jgi:hypothetical protein